MNKYFALAVAAACSSAAARTPATNPMPDGSRDMYAGAGAVSAPRYEGAQDRKLRALPVLQVQWSNGAFLSGMSAGIHLSPRPSVEFGPLLVLQPGRSLSGTRTGADDIESSRMAGIVSMTQQDDQAVPAPQLEELHARLLFGGFFNYYLSPQWRATSSLLWGAGNERNGGRLELGVQRVAAELGAHHALSLSAGVTIANRDYNQAYFGAHTDEVQYLGNPGGYRAGGGLKDAHLGARWNWALSPSWLLTSSLKATQLLGSPKNSPLIERTTNLTVSTAVAYRF